METKHDKLVNDLERKLLEGIDYEKIWKFFEYCRNGQIGEVDLLGYKNEVYDFYEVKSNYHQKAKKRAYKQFIKFRLAFPKRKVNGFLYCGKGLIRL